MLLNFEKVQILTSGVHAYHDMNAIINPIVEKKNVLPYIFRGFSAGTDCALWLMGLTFGAVHSIDIAIEFESIAKVAMLKDPRILCARVFVVRAQRKQAIRYVKISTKVEI